MEAARLKHRLVRFPFQEPVCKSSVTGFEHVSHLFCFYQDQRTLLRIRSLDKLELGITGILWNVLLFVKYHE